MNFIYDKITNLIIDKLESGVVPWQKNWKTSLPKNFVSGLDYKGINIMLLGMQDFESNYWLSFKQCRDIGGTVKKDEKSTMVVFWKPIVNFKDNESDELPEAKINFLLRYYFVFNIAQCNIPDEVLKKKNTIPTNPKIMEAEKIIEGYPNPPEIAINNMIPNPRYLPRLDRVEIPSIENFKTSDDYYASLYHELAHSTGAKHRLCRKGIIDTITFRSEQYSKEELISEISASFLCNISGIEKTIDNQSSYIANWLQVLKNDNRMVLIAASQAQKACDYILNNSTTNQKEAE
jgi:antirestriction protein ArdC